MKEATKVGMEQTINEPISEGRITKFQMNVSFRQVFLINMDNIR
jgi:hypothetical protein